MSHKIEQPGALVVFVVPAEVLAQIPEDARRFTAGGDQYLFTDEDQGPRARDYHGAALYIGDRVGSNWHRGTEHEGVISFIAGNEPVNHRHVVVTRADGTEYNDFSHLLYRLDPTGPEMAAAWRLNTERVRAYLDSLTDDDIRPAS